MADLDLLMAAIAVSIAELSDFLPWARDGMPSEGAQREVLREGQERFDQNVCFEYTLREAVTSELVGGAGLRLTTPSDTAEIGYWVRTDRTGLGYATAAAGALTATAFEHLPALQRVEIRMDQGNAASASIPPRLGFVCTGDEQFRNAPSEAQTGQGWIWTMTRTDWFSRTEEHGV